MTHKDEALKLALSCIRSSAEYKRGNASFIEAAEDVEQALAAPVQEPVAWTVKGSVADWSKDFSKYQTQHYTRPVYTTPPAAQPAYKDNTPYLHVGESAFENLRKSAKLKERNV
jgi:hypothetical protein